MNFSLAEHLAEIVHRLGFDLSQLATCKMYSDANGEIIVSLRVSDTESMIVSVTRVKTPFEGG